MPTRINKFVAQSTGLSRRAADQAISEGRVKINDVLGTAGDQITETDRVSLDGIRILAPSKTTTIILNKPFGYVCSREGQGSQTVYELLPEKYHKLKTVGRLDKDSSGLILLTDDGDLAQELTHPKYTKTKIYEVRLSKTLEPLHQQMINDIGVQLQDGRSKLILQSLDDSRQIWQVTMSEGRNRQIRRTFESLGYKVTKLHRTKFGNYDLGNLEIGKYL